MFRRSKSKIDRSLFQNNFLSRVALRKLQYDQAQQHEYHTPPRLFATGGSQWAGRTPYAANGNPWMNRRLARDAVPMYQPYTNTTPQYQPPMAQQQQAMYGASYNNSMQYPAQQQMQPPAGGYQRLLGGNGLVGTNMQHQMAARPPMPSPMMPGASAGGMKGCGCKNKAADANMNANSSAILPYPQQPMPPQLMPDGGVPGNMQTAPVPPAADPPVMKKISKREVKKMLKEVEKEYMMTIRMNQKRERVDPQYRGGWTGFDFPQPIKKQPKKMIQRKVRVIEPPADLKKLQKWHDKADKQENRRGSVQLKMPSGGFVRVPRDRIKFDPNDNSNNNINNANFSGNNSNDLLRSLCHGGECDVPQTTRMMYKKSLLPKQHDIVEKLIQRKVSVPPKYKEECKKDKERRKRHARKMKQAESGEDIGDISDSNSDVSGEERTPCAEREEDGGDEDIANMRRSELQRRYGKSTCPSCEDVKDSRLFAAKQYVVTLPLKEIIERYSRHKDEPGKIYLSKESMEQDYQTTTTGDEETEEEAEENTITQ